MARGELGVERVCCLLHNLIPGGSGRQWLHLLARQVDSGGEATILAPPGPLAEAAEAAGIEVVPTVWAEAEAAGWGSVSATAARSDLALVHWDFEVMHAFRPALEACGRAALVVHQPPRQLAAHGPEVMVEAEAVLRGALRERRGILFVRGAAHRRRFEAAFDIPEGRLRILPASIPLPPFSPDRGTEEILAMARHSPEKLAIPRVAVELTREALARGLRCRLTIAGDGGIRERVEALCAERLPPEAWRSEPAPADPIRRLAAADVVVAQGLTTLEAAALGRRVVVARTVGDDGAAGTVLLLDRYDEAARDPFGQPELTADAGALLDEVLAIDEGELAALRARVETHNSLAASAAAIRDVVAAT